MSTNSVSAPAWLIASTVAMNVCDTVMTASPRPTPAAISAKRTASVPLATPTQNLVPQYVGELPLEALDLRTADEGGRAQRLAKGVDELLFELAMRCHQIEKGNGRRCHRALGAVMVATERGRVCRAPRRSEDSDVRSEECDAAKASAMATTAERAGRGP